VAANKKLILLAVSAALALSVGLAATMWLMQRPNAEAALRPAAEVMRQINRPREVRREICSFEKEIYLSDKKVCLYACSKGEKSRVEGVEKCLKTVEL